MAVGAQRTEFDSTVVAPVPVPAHSRVARRYAWVDLADAYEIRMPIDASSDPEQLARFLFSHQAPWLAPLMALRDLLVAGFGIKTSRALERSDPPGSARRIGLFRIYERAEDEIVLGEDDVHLDFRVSVLRRVRAEPDGPAAFLIASTVVHCHNRLGRLYLWFIAPFHRQVVQAGLRRSARAGWPRPAANAAPGSTRPMA